MSRPFTLPVVIACSAHALLMFGFKKPEMKPPVKPIADKSDCGGYVVVPIVEDEEKTEPVTSTEKAAGGKLAEPTPISIDHPAESFLPGDILTEWKQSEMTPVKVNTRIIPAGPGSPDGDPNAPEYGPGSPDGKPLVFPSTALDNMPRARVQNLPAYPFNLKAGGISGEVLLEFVVDERGRVTHPRILRSTHPDFEPATLNAVSKWRFEPGTRKMKPVSFKMVVPVKFNLNE